MMKKALTYTLAVALLLSLAACGKSQAEQPDQSEPPTQAATSTPVPESTTTPEPATTTEPTAQTPAAPEQLGSTTQAAPNEADTSQPPEETESQEPAEEVQLFTDVNETVYATGTVNIRESYTADSTKLGSLSAGQSVVRTGVAIAGTEAEGWSRIQLTDGSIVYVSSKYLSTTKPVTQSSNNTQSKPTGQSQGGGTTTTTTTPPAGGGETDAEIEARKQEFLNSMQQVIEDNGYTAGYSDHDLTEEELDALVKAVQVGG